MRIRILLLFLALSAPSLWAQQPPKQRPTGFKVPEAPQMNQVLRTQRMLSSALKDAAGPNFAWGPAAPDIDLTHLPASFDWQQRHGVTDVRDQGSCGDCWAFATTAALEAAYKIRLNVAIDASEKNVLDCTPTDSCGGGMFQQAFELMRDHGIAKETDYQYPKPPATVAKTEFEIAPVAFHALNFDYVDSNNTLIPSNEALKKALVLKGPLAIGIRVSNEFMNFTGDGVFDKDEDEKLIPLM